MNHPARKPRYRELTVAGEPRDMGRQLGEALLDVIREFCDEALRLVRKTVAISDASVAATIATATRRAVEYAPDHVEELRGVAEAAGVPFDAVMLLQTRNQMLPDPEAGCTSVALAARPGIRGSNLVAQNWDNDPALDRFTVVLTRRPTGKPALLNVTQAGLIAYIGCNDAGIGVCLNTLPAPARRDGVPHYFTVREIFAASSLDGAVTAVRRATRAIPANIMLATPQGPADLEVTIDAVHVLRDDECVTHANHCRHPDLQALGERFPELIQSHARQARIDRLLHERSTPVTVQDLQQLLANHEDYPRSLCRHANHDPGTGFWETVFSVIIEPDARQLHLCRGQPCCQPYEVYKLANEQSA